MKHLKFFSNICLLLLVLTGFSCSENDSAVEVPVFPSEQQVVTVKPGETVTLTFDANLDWKLYSSAIWCKFSNDLTSINGEAGTAISVPLSINEDTWSLDDEVAEISLYMGGEEKVIARYSRNGFTATISDVNGTVYTEENPLKFEYKNGDVKNIITFSANFDWKIEEETLPEWIVINPESLIGGKGGKSINVTFNVPKSYWVESNTGNVTVKSMVSDDKLTIPVKYSGLPEGVVEVDGVDGNPFWWKIAADGQTFWKDGSLDGSEPEKISLPFNFNVLAKDNAYNIVHLFQKGNYLYSPNEYDKSFCSFSDDKQGNITIESIEENTGSQRNAYFYAMPDDVYQEVSAGGDPALVLDDGNGMTKTEYDEYLIFAFKQEESQVEGDDFIVYTGNEEQLSVNKIVNPSDELVEQCMTDNIYECVLAKDVAYPEFEITSNKYPVSSESWQTHYGDFVGDWYPYTAVIMNSFRFMNSQAGDFALGVDAGYIIEEGIKVPNKPFYIIIYDSNWAVTAALLIKRAE